MVYTYTGVIKMPINQNIYPYNAQVGQLPIYLTGIGGSEYQNHIRRSEGYTWYQILYSANGTGCLKYDNVTVTLGPGQYFYLPKNYPHEYYPTSQSWDVRWVAFDGYACKQIASLLRMEKPVVVKPSDDSALQKIYKRMFVSQKSDKVYCDLSCSGFVYQYMLELHRRAFDKNSYGGSDRSDLLLPVLNYIDDNFEKDFPLTELARLIKITPQHLCRIFKETMHMKPSEYLTKRRLSEAKELLKYTDRSVSDICRLSGFSDASYFSTVFRRYEGMSPLVYRKKSREGLTG